VLQVGTGVGREKWPRIVMASEPGRKRAEVGTCHARWVPVLGGAVAARSRTDAARRAKKEPAGVSSGLWVSL